MSEIIKSQKRNIQYNGVVDSSDYNRRIEENYDDLVNLYNKVNIIDSKLAQAFERVIKDQAFLVNSIYDLEDRVSALEQGYNVMSIHSYSQVDYGSFLGTQFSISSTEVLSFDPYYNVVTLPVISTSSTSKVKFFSNSAGQIIPDYFKTAVQNSYSGVDSSGSVVDTTPTYYCILDDPNKVWKRNIISQSANSAGAQMMFYVKIPVEYTGTTKTNCIKLNPYPMKATDIYSIEYTTKASPNLTDSDGWTALNYNNLYDGLPNAIGKVPPGGWYELGSDTIRNSGPLCFYFGDLDITAIRIKMNQKNYLKENGSYIYTYGLSNLDIRHDKFLTSGKMIFKFDAPTGKLIDTVASVSPVIYNVPNSLLSTAFSYRVIYKDGDIYTLDNPGASSSVWIEVTLNMLEDYTPPVLSDLKIQYSFVYE
jgi:hypothetical protein